MTLVITFRYSISLTQNFENPIERLTFFLQNLDVQNLEEISIESFQDFLTSIEFKALFEALIVLVNNLKFTN